MSFLGLLQQTGLLATWTRKSYASRASSGEQVITTPVVVADVPARMQTVRQEDLDEAGIVTETATIKWLLFLPYTWAGVTLNIRNGDKITFNRMPTNVTYYNAIHDADAVAERHHHELIIEERYQA